MCYPVCGGSTELFHILASAPQLMQQRPWYVLACLWDGAYKRTLVANLRVVHVAAAGFLSEDYLSYPLP